jgi:hypothetical protein
MADELKKKSSISWTAEKVRLRVRNLRGAFQKKIDRNDPSIPPFMMMAFENEMPLTPLESSEYERTAASTSQEGDIWHAVWYIS